MSYAKQIFSAPMSVLAQAAGAASMPFFATLWSQQRRYEFAISVADSVSRVAALGMLAASGIVALAGPLVELLFVGRRFSPSDARECAGYLAIFSVSMFLWSAQAVYSRAFFAAGNTLVPMAAGTVITVVSWPMYAALYHWHGAIGLAIASDFGIAVQTGTIAVLLHRRRMVSLASLDFAELGRCLVTALAAGGVVWTAIWGLGHLPIQLLHSQRPGHIRWADLSLLAVGCALWVMVAKWTLEKTGSALPKVAMRRLGLG
jgi:putative peptidoglycan lipid II flippase